MRRSPLVLALLACLAVPVLQAPPALAGPTSAATPGQSTYVPVAPSRVLDTRNGTGGRTGALGSGEAYDLALPLPAGATAAVLNVTAVKPTTETVIRVYPTPASGSAVPTVSNLNAIAGATVADLVVTKVGGGNSIRLRNDSGSTHLIADLAGYYVTGGSAAGFTGTPPVRVLDTRPGTVPLGAGQPRTVDLTLTKDGAPSGVPANASAVVVNLTAINPTGNTVIRAYPGSAIPTVSNLNPAKGQTVANLAVVATDLANGKPEITLLNGSGRVDMAVDLAGWYVPGEGDVFHPVDPYRVLDTRTTSAPVIGGSPRALTLAGNGAIPFGASSVALTITAVKPSKNTVITAYPAVRGTTTGPDASNLNPLAGQVVPNAAVVATGDEGLIRLSSYQGSTHLVADAAGWFGPPGEGYDISWPQCTPDRTGTTSRHPAGGAFAVIGLTNGKPYTTNACLADEFAWAESLPGGGSTYIILNAPGAGDPNWGTTSTPQACDGTTSVGCAYDYGWGASDFALQTLPATTTGGRPQVWLDVEGQYSSGPVWQATLTSGGGYTYSAEQQAVNAAVVRGARDRLRAAGVRTGIYSRRSTTNASGARSDDWFRLTGGLKLTNVQQWVFPRSTDADEANNPPSDARKAELAAINCVPEKEFVDGWVVFSQYQTVVDGVTYDTNHPC